MPLPVPVAAKAVVGSRLSSVMTTRSVEMSLVLSVFNVIPPTIFA
jgi:hypothetical protein